MIRAFKCSDTERLHKGFFVKRFSGITEPARRRLLLLDAALSLNDLAAIRGNRLEALLGDRKGQHSIRINSQWRICFRWADGQAVDVELVDYH